MDFQLFFPHYPSVHPVFTYTSEHKRVHWGSGINCLTWLCCLSARLNFFCHGHTRWLTYCADNAQQMLMTSSPLEQHPSIFVCSFHPCSEMLLSISFIFHCTTTAKESELTFNSVGVRVSVSVYLGRLLCHLHCNLQVDKASCHCALCVLLWFRANIQLSWSPHQHQRLPWQAFASSALQSASWWSFMSLCSVCFIMIFLRSRFSGSKWRCMGHWVLFGFGVE